MNEWFWIGTTIGMFLMNIGLVWSNKQTITLLNESGNVIVQITNHLSDARKVIETLRDTTIESETKTVRMAELACFWHVVLFTILRANNWSK